MAEEKSKVDSLKEKLFYKRENAAEKLTQSEVAEADAFCEGYKDFLNRAKTEREATAFMEVRAKAHGFEKFEPEKAYAAGDKVYYNNRGKAIILAVIGEKPLPEGIRLTAAHIDSPRLDLKPSPLYEDSNLALFKTHYYGGIKKYQWTCLPLALHGVIVKKDGEKVEVRIGEEAGEPQFAVTDLLPHLAGEQMKRTLADGVRGEELNVLVGSRPFSADEGSEKVKLNILNILFEKYGVTEGDFLSAELEVVPAYHACDIGFDRSMIGSYGHDDRVCAYPAAEAIFALESTPAYTAVTVLTDKEEIGSEGNTGLNSAYLEHFIADLAAARGENVRTVLRNTKCLSADVTAAFDPTYPDVCERNNAAFINGGAAFMKYSGARGKSGTSDASAEYMAAVRRMLDENGVIWQCAELGKVDAGGGGTVAMFLASLGMDVVDIGVPVLSMHAPFEIVSKLDVFMTYRACKAFFEEK